MGKTTVKPGNSHYSEGGRMPSTAPGHQSGCDRGNNPPSNGGSQGSGRSGGSSQKGGKR